MQYPKLTEEKPSTQTIAVFKGYNHNLKIDEGEFYETKNLTTAYYPLMANRKKRSAIRTLTSAQGMIEKDALAYIDNGTLYYNQYETAVTGLSAGEKQLVSMGAYIIIFPDKVYYNTQDSSDYGSMEANWSYTGSVSYKMCDSDGTDYDDVIVSDTQPSSTTEGATWLDTSTGELKQYSTSYSMWQSISTVYTKVTFNTQGQLPAVFNEYDGVTVSGLYYSDLNGEKILYTVGGDSSTTRDYIVLVGIMPDMAERTVDSSTVTVNRKVPTLDYVCECQNRLWGCYYGNDGTQNLNEIYCCALGDFKNWSQFLGLSTDSYTASVGSDGRWTGCINYLGYPTFFKENTIHRVSVSSTGAHQITETPAPGVQKGSEKSLVVIDSTMFYKGRTAVYAYQGSFPEAISDALGEVTYGQAVGGAFGKRYYLSMIDTSNAWHFFCYDISKGMWMHEDSLHAVQMVKVDDELYCLDSDGNMIGINGVVGTQEADFEWEAVTGILHTTYKSSSYTYQIPEKKTVYRYDVRAKMELEAEMRIYIEYDSSGVWEYAGSLKWHGTGTTVFPVRPRRCDHCRLKIVGKGEVRLFSIARQMVKGSDA